MFNLSKKNSLISKATLSEILDITISPKLKELGLVKQTDYLWYPSSPANIRPGIKYTLLKGEQGTLTWGVCIDFIPLPSGNNLAFHNTNKKFACHVFDWPEAYSNSFFGGSLEKAVATHWGRNEFEKSIKRLFERNIETMFKWFIRANNLENTIDILKQQIQTGRQYNLHYPNPKYVLAFLYAKSNQPDKSIQLFDSLELNYFRNNESLRDKTRKKLIEISEDKTVV